MLGKIEGRGRRVWQGISWLDGITKSMDNEFEQTPGDSEGQRSLACCSPRGHRVGHDRAAEQQLQSYDKSIKNTFVDNVRIAA